jgi:KAT8 regulatory NSL complex subunit 1
MLYFSRLPKESENNKNSGSDGTSAVVNNDILMESIDQQTTAGSDDSPKLEQLLLDSLAAVVTSSSTSVTSTLGFQNFGPNSIASQSTSDPPEMPQLMSILNELLDGQDITSLANTGGNGDNMPDMVDQEENYEDDSPRKDDPEELTRLLVQQRLEEIRQNEQLLQRKMDFFVRRLYKLVARSTGLHASEEITGFLEQVARHNKNKDIGSKFPCLTANLQGVSLLSPVTPTPEPPFNLLSSPSIHHNGKILPDVKGRLTEIPKPVPVSEMKSFLRRIESLSTLQSTMINKRAHALKYFVKPSLNSLSAMSKSDTSLLSSTIFRFEEKVIEHLDQVSGLLMSEMRLIENQIDSDATASSSGGESADEMVSHNNHYQHPLSM